MNAETALSEAYQEWRRLAETEGEAIRAGDWGLLAASQRALEHLRDRITKLTDAAKTEWAQLGENFSGKEKNFRAVVSELIQLERHNMTLLAAVRQSFELRRAQLNQAGRNLRRIQRSYAPPRPAIWNSFS